MKKISLFLFAFIAATSLVFGTVGSAADCTTVVVTGSDITEQPENTPPSDNWVLFKRAAGDGDVRTGPATPPAGIGSYQLVTPTGADKATLFNFDHVNTPLADVDTIGYSTYRTSGQAAQVAALNLQVDVNGAAPGGFTTLVFEPVYNTAQGTVQDGVWQTWDAFNGGNAIWWSSNAIPGAPNRDTFVTWSTIVAANPDAIIVGGVGINQGSGNPGLVTAVDNFQFGYGDDCFAYDFEPFRVAATKDQCKAGGWQQVRRADGSTFKNQGDCVSYVSNGK